MLRVIIVDDEQPAIELMKILLDKSGGVSIIGTFRKAKEALEQIPVLKPDVAFLDIHMPTMSGMELAARITELYEDTEIVFTTAYDNYALQAFRLNAIDYLLKPVSDVLLNRTIKRLSQRRGYDNWQQPYKAVGSQINCFGGFKVMRNAADVEPVKWRTTKSEELMAYLLIKGEKVDKWKIMDSLWPECTKEQAHSNLHTTMYRLKKTLKDAQIDFRIVFQSGAYQLVLPDLLSDRKEFDDFILAQYPISEHTVKMYDQKLSLYAGDLFGDLDYPWCISEREKYRESFFQLSKQWCQFQIEIGLYEAAADRIRNLLNKSILDEEAHEMLLNIYFLQNDRVSFIKHYQKLSDLLRTELGLEPNESIRRLYEKVLKK